MTNEEFIMMAKLEVKRYTYDNVAKDGTSLFHVYVVWQVKVLQNYKALLATDIEGDQHYYEATYNGDKKQLYLDVYDKQENKCFEVEVMKLTEKQKCGVCHKRFATKWCDYVIQYPESPTFICGRTSFQDFLSAQRQITCDCALCDECAKNHGLIDFCPYHEKIVKQEKLDTPDYVVKSRVETWRRENE